MAYEIEIELGALKDAPVYEGHSRGRNWFAKIRKDPSAPAGLGRDFAKKAHGDEYYYFLPDNFIVGTAVEFGADYYTGGGNKRPERWYGVIIERTDEKIVLEECGTARQAINLGQEISEGRDKPVTIITIPRSQGKQQEEFPAITINSN